MADKKISELPLITTISGSIVYVPIVHDGITEKITVEDFSKFTNKYAAQTGSVNIFTANQTINANLSVNGTSTVSGNASVGGNLVVNGKLTAQELFTEITSASIIFESGSTIFGNSSDDTHQFTGIVSINGTTIGAQALNDFTASTNSQLQRVYQTTSSLNIQTGSQDLVNLRISSTTGSINTTTSSFDSVFLRISSTTGSINTTTSSFDSVFLRISSTTGSINTTTSSFNSEFIKIGSTTSSIHFTTQSLNTQTGSQDNLNAQIGIATGSLNAFTGSVIGQTNTISTFTASVNFTTQSLNTQTGSQNSINFNISVVTSSIDAHILKQATQTGSQDLVNYNISVVTSSIDAHILKQATQTGSQDLVNYQNSIITSSYRIELNSIEAYTSSLKNAIIVNGSNVQIVGTLDVAKLNVQYVSSSVLITSGSNVFGDQSSDKHEFTGSVNLQDTLFIKGVAQGTGELNAFTGSQIGKDFTLSVVTSSIDTHILKQATQTGSQDLVNYNISVYTGSQNVINNSVNSHILVQSIQTGSQDIVNFNISVVTSSIDSHILVQSIQTGSQDLVNLGISTFTGSLRSEVNLIEAYTASLKGAAIVSSSQQITNYYKFAETASANTVFYGNVTASGNLQANQLYIGGATTSTGLIGASEAVVQNELGIQYGDATGTYMRLIANGANSNTAIQVGAFSGANPSLDLIASEGSTAISIKSDAGVNFAGSITGSKNLTVVKAAIGSTVTPSIPLEVYGQQKWFTTTGDGSELRGFFNPGGAADDPYLSLYQSDGTTEGIKITPDGIDFSANSNAAGMTSELLNDYEEGTWTPTVVAGSGTYTTISNARGTYTKIGRQVTVQFYFIVADKGTGTTSAQITNLPFTVKSTSAGDQYVGSMINTSTSVISSVIAGQNDTFAGIYKYDATDPITVSQGNAGTLTYFT
jgi:hypothetical protein